MRGSVDAGVALVDEQGWQVTEGERRTLRSSDREERRMEGEEEGEIGEEELRALEEDVTGKVRQLQLKPACCLY